MLKFYSKFLVILLLTVGAGLADNISTAIIKKVLENSDQSSVFSPALLTDGLWQLYLTTESKTADEIGQVLQLNGQNKSQSLEDYEIFRNKLMPLAHVTWHRASKLFLDVHVNVLLQFLQKSKEIFQSEPQFVDFSNSTATISVINDWLSMHSIERFTKLMDQTNSEMKAMFLSVFNFKGLWKDPFDIQLTQQQDFHVPLATGGTRTIKVDMMFQRGRHRLNSIEKLDALSLELPYENTNISMVILLPNSVDGLAKLIANLDTLDMAELAPKSYEMEVKIYLPKFKINSTLDMKKALKNLGVFQLFEGDFKVDEIRQSTAIEVDEEGSQMFINEERRFSYINFPMVVIDVRIDHPFVFLIKDDDIVYVAGRITME